MKYVDFIDAKHFRLGAVALDAVVMPVLNIFEKGVDFYLNEVDTYFNGKREARTGYQGEQNESQTVHCE